MRNELSIISNKGHNSYDSVLSICEISISVYLHIFILLTSYSTIHVSYELNYFYKTKKVFTISVLNRNYV